MDAAATIRAARERAGLTLRALATRAGTSHSTLAAYEQGRKVPRVDTLERICRAAGFVFETRLVARAGGDGQSPGRDLVDVLELADAFPHERTGPLDTPVFGRLTGRR